MPTLMPFLPPPNLQVDGERHLLPLTLAGGAVTVTQEGAHQVLRAQGGLKLLYDTVSYVLLTLPASYRHHTGGLCGNFDGDAANDAADPEELGSNWGIPVRGCKHGSQPEPCPQSKPELCSLLEDETGPFGGCHKVVAPWEHAASCMQEGCGKAGGVELCRVLQAYAAACQAAGGELQEWREAAKCREWAWGRRGGGSEKGGAVACSNCLIPWVARRCMQRFCGLHMVACSFPAEFACNRKRQSCRVCTQLH